MEFLLLILLVASIPVFYIYGIIKFFTSRQKPKSDLFEGITDRKILLKELIRELTAKLEKDENLNVNHLLDEYQKELSALNSFKEPASETIVFHTEAKSEQIEEVVGVNNKSIWEHWYTENSINLLLYIGAFLIVASASIFVGLGWQTFSGTLKASFLSIITVAFFGFGSWFYYQPKVKNAGVTFSAISALLLPFCSIAWYNFVLKDLGLTFGTVWLITSLLSLCFYTFLSFWQKSIFYAYASTLGVVSFMLSLVNVYGLNSDFYVLNSIISVYALFGTRILLAKTKNKYLSHFSQAIEISENIILPLTIIFGFSIALSSNKLFSFESSLSMLLVTIYYFLTYILNKKPIHLTISAILFPITISLFYSWRQFPGTYLAYTLDVVSIFYLIFAYIFYKYQKSEELNINLILSQTITIIVFVISYISAFHSTDLFILSLTPIIVSIAGKSIKAKPELLITTSVFSGISMYLLFGKILKWENQLQLLSVAFMGLATCYFGLAAFFRQRSAYLKIFGPTVVIYIAIGMLFVYDKALFIFAESLYISLISLLSVFIFKKSDLLFISNLFLFLSLWNFLSFIKLPLENYPFYFTGLSVLFYVLSLISSEELSDRYRKSALSGLAVIPYMFGFYSQTDVRWDHKFSAFKQLEQNSLLSSIVSILIFGRETAISKSWSIGYFTSALAIISVLWQIKLFNYQNIQFYIIPLALYFMALSYTRKIKHDEEKRNMLDVVALTILILPTTIQAFSDNGSKYALSMGIEGILLLFLGISWQYRIYRYGAIIAIVLAVFSQAYGYIFSLPRWVITGIAGLLFLIVAVTLLLKRKDSSES